MSDKILCWLSNSVVPFGVIKFIQQKHDCEIFAIADITDKQKKFYQHQQIVKFNKIWYYHDFIAITSKKPDLEYLSTFEKKYSINLWLLAINERFFSHFNDFHKFSYREILLILEQECKLFENILDEVNPDFAITGYTTFHHDQLFFELCKSKRIRTLMLQDTHIGFRRIISDPTKKLDFKNYPNSISTTNLQNFFKKHDTSKEAKELIKTFQNSKIDLLKAILNYLSSNKTNVKTHYTYYGRSKFNVLLRMLIYTLRTKYREFFINRYLSYKIDELSPFIYFPLHMEQEQVLLIGAPFYTNQFEVISNIAKSLPIGYKLLVKEHPIMKLRGWHSTSFYKKIMALPNIQFLHYSVNNDEILKKCSLVITIRGTTGLDAAFHQKPSVIFTDTTYSALPSVYRLKSIEELPHVIRKSLQIKVNLMDVARYVDFINENSFECDVQSLDTAMQNYFQYGGYLVDVEIPIEKMEIFLNEHKSTFEQLANEFIKKFDSKKL